MFTGTAIILFQLQLFKSTLQRSPTTMTSCTRLHVWVVLHGNLYAVTVELFPLSISWIICHWLSCRTELHVIIGWNLGIIVRAKKKMRCRLCSAQCIDACQLCLEYPLHYVPPIDTFEHPNIRAWFVQLFRFSPFVFSSVRFASIRRWHTHTPTRNGNFWPESIITMHIMPNAASDTHKIIPCAQCIEWCEGGCEYALPSVHCMTSASKIRNIFRIHSIGTRLNTRFNISFSTSSNTIMSIGLLRRCQLCKLTRSNVRAGHGKSEWNECECEWIPNSNSPRRA